MRNAFLEEKRTKKALAGFVRGAKRLSMGEKCFEFEQAFSQYQGRRHGILFNSGGSANLALLQALKNLGRLQSGDEVGFSALTWATNVMPIIQLGMLPVAIDCSPNTLNVHARDLRTCLQGHRLKAVFITNALGFVGDLDEIKALCREKGAALLEDNCESLGSELPSGKAGNFGLAATFSFYVAHHMSTIEGGMVCTDDEELAEMLSMVRANGWDRNLPRDGQKKWRERNHVQNDFEAKYSFYDLGFNLRPTEITGFLGLQQLKYLEKSICIRESNFLLMEESIRKNRDFKPLDHSHMKRVSNFAVPVICRDVATRAAYLKRFMSAGVEVRPIIAGNIQRQPFYRKYVATNHRLENTDFIHECGFYFGNYPELTRRDLDTLRECLVAL
jgi:CDP-6-deoxy-D-xylo-4-hexulose-3-dehydrase